MYLELMRDVSKVFPQVENPREIHSLSVWHCKYKTLQSLAEFANLRALKIATFPDASLEFISELKQLEWLSILHLPKITNLNPLSSMATLRYVELQTLPSWDISRKRTTVDTLVPLTRLSALEHLSLLGVVSKAKSLSEIEACTSLRSAKFFGYPKQEIDRFFSLPPKIVDRHIPHGDDFFPDLRRTLTSGIGKPE
jgi:hypothetical protein